MRRILALVALASACYLHEAAAEGTFELRQEVASSSPIFLEGSLAPGNVNYDQHRVTFLRVDIFDPANEVIDLYGQALSGSPDIQVWCPGRIPLVTPDAPYSVPTPDFTADFTSAVGALTSFADVQNVQSIGSRPRPPRTYSLTGATASCGSAGVYTLRYSSAGIDGAGQPFFDIRVRNTATSTLETGRVWADKYAFSMTNGSGRVGAELYVVAGTDRGDDYLGIVWLLDLNDIAPFGFQLFANDRGVGPAQYNYQSIGGTASPPPQMNPLYPIYLNPPAKPVTTPGALGNIEAIDTQCVAGGATDVFFRFDTAGALPFTFRVDEDQDGQFDLDEVVLTGNSVDGTNTVVWDGTLPSGAPIGSGTTYQVELSLTTGEVHFPFYDVEDADPGPIILPFSISSSPATDLYYWDDTNPSITSTTGGGTTSGPNGSLSTHNWANGLNNYRDANMIDTWKYAEVQSIQDVYELPTSCDAAPAIGLAKDAAITADNGDGSVELTLDFRIENLGNIDLQGVQLTDDIAAALPAPVSWSVDAITTSANLTANTGFDGVSDTQLLDAAGSTLPLGDVGLISVVLNVDFNGETGPFTNTATVDADDGTTPVSDVSQDGDDPDPDGNGIPDEDTPTPLPVAESDLAVGKTVDVSNPYVDETITWTVTVTNNGPVTETGAELTESLPASFTVDSVTPSAGSWTAPIWSLPALAPGQSETLTIVGRFTTDGGFSNSAEITAAVNPDPDSTPGNDQPTEDDQAESAVVVDPLADVSVTKTDGGVSVVPGTSATYQLEVANAGPSPVTGVVLDDVTPAGLVLDSVDAPCAGGFPCTLPAIASGASITVGVTFSVPPGYSGSDPISNTATVTSPVDDPDPANDSATETTPLAPPQADLAVTKSVDNATPNEGSNVTFTIAVVNNGPSNATGVTVNDLLPSGYSFVSASESQGSYDSGTGVWAIGALADAGTATLQIVATVSTSGDYQNVASVNGNETDPVGGNNDDDASVSPVPVADLAIGKTDGGVSVVPGTNVTYTITVENLGPSAADNVVVSDPAPAGLTFVSTSAPCGSLPCNVGTIAASGSAGYTVTFAVPSGYAGPDPITNTASVTSDAADPVPGNNSAIDTTPLAPSSADLAVSKSVDNASPEVGSNVTFTIGLVNNGPSDATGVELTDVLPTGYTFVSSAASQGGYDDGTGVWTVGTVVDGGSASLAITAEVLASGATLNTAAVSASDATDPVPGNDQDSADTTPVPSADLAVTKIVDDATPGVGDTVTFTVTVANNGPSDATNVAVNDALPAGYTFVSSTPSQGDYTAPTWTVGNLANGASASLDITATVEASGPYTNTATGTATENDPDPSNDEDSESTSPVAQADLAVTKTVDDATPDVGDTVTFTVTVINSGPSDATNVSIDDALPAGYTFVSSTASQGSYAAPVWTVGALANGASASLDITATVEATGPYTNTAIGTASENDPDLTDNEDSETTTPVAQADLAVTKVVDDATPNVGDTVTFTVTVSNNGPSDATSVSVNDALPAGYTLVSATPDQGGYTAPTWAVGNLANGASATLAIMATVNANGPYDNTATGSATENDPDPFNNEDTATTTPVAQADLVVTKTVDDAAPNVGATVAFTITVANNGPSNATNVSVNDALPSGYTLDSATPSQGSYAAPTWTVGSLVNGASATLEIVATVEASGDYENIATGTATEDDPDPTNNEDTAVTTPVAQADLVVTKTVDSATPNVGETVTFTVTVTNAGPSDASNVSVDDALPSGYSLVSATPSVGSYAEPTWTVGSLVNGASATLEIVATVEASGDYTNTATGTATEDDPDPTNNEDTATTNPVEQADLSVTKDDGGATVIPGETVSYVIAVVNDGPSTATGVTLDDPTPSGLVFVSADAPCAGGFPCSLGDLADGASASVTVVFEVPSDYSGPDPISNTASVSSATADPDPSNDDATDTTPVDPAEADLAVVKTVTPEEPSVGDTVTFTIEVSNNGPSDATGVVVNDPLPAGYTFVSSSASQGSYTAPDWTVGGLADGASATLTIEATVTATDDYLNVATASGNETDPDPSNDSDEATIRRIVLDLTTVCVDDTAYVNYTVTPLGFTAGANPVDIEWITEDGNATIVETLTGEPLTGQLLWPGTTLDGGGNPTDWPGWDFVGGEWVEVNDGLRPDMRIRASINPEDEGVVTYPPALPTCSANPPVADLAVTKDDGGAVAPAGGSVVYTIEVTNNGPSEADSVVVDDVTPAGLVFNNNSGACTTAFPCSLGTLDVDETVTIQATLDVPIDYAGADPIANTATVSSNTQELDESDNEASDTTPVAFDGQNPVIGLAKRVVSQSNGDPVGLTLGFTVANLGNVPLDNVQVIDDLMVTFPAPVSFTVEAIDASGGLTANPAFDGSGDIRLLDAASSSLALGEAATIELVLSLQLGPTSPRRFENTSMASAEGPVGQVTEDMSNDGLLADPNNDGDPTPPEENLPTPIDLRGFQVYPVPVVGIPGLMLMTLLLMLLGGWVVNARRP